MAVRFDWDPRKAASNLAKHGVSFETAQEAFKDTRAYVEIDDRHDYDEERFIRIAMVGVRYLFVSYTESMAALGGDEIIRIISARKATPHERRTYHEGQAAR
jgi:uncharacterized DUF497 family protein